MMTGTNRYSEYKDSGVQWLGRIPRHWKTIRIKHLLNERVDKSKDGKEEPLSMSQKRGIIPTKLMEVVPNMAASFIGAKKVFVNDLVFNKLKAHLGVFAISNYDGLVSPDYAVYYPTAIANGRFLDYLFHTQLYIGEFKRNARGIVIGLTRLYTNQLFAIPCVYPPLSEQCAIVSYLDEKVGSIDTCISGKEEEIEKLKLLKQSIIAKAVTQGLDENVEMKESGIQWLSKIPKHWEVDRVGSCFRERKTKVSDEDYLALSVSKAFGVSPQLDNVALTNAKGETRKLVKQGDYVVNSRSDRKGSCGVSDYEGCVSLIYIVLQPMRLEKKYVHYLFRSNTWVEEFYRNGKGIVADLWTTNYQSMKSMIIPLPPLPEQQAIVAYIDEKTKAIDTLVSQLEMQIERLKIYKQRLISDVVTGQIKVF